MNRTPVEVPLRKDFYTMKDVYGKMFIIGGF